MKNRKLQGCKRFTSFNQCLIGLETTSKLSYTKHLFDFLWQPFKLKDHQQITFENRGFFFHHNFSKSHPFRLRQLFT